MANEINEQSEYFQSDDDDVFEGVDLDEVLTEDSNLGEPVIVEEEDLLQDEMDECYLDEIPTIVFVNEKSEDVVLIQDKKLIPEAIYGKAMTINRSTLYTCKKCQKIYQIERFYLSHVDNCSKAGMFYLQVFIFFCSVVWFREAILFF